MTYPTPAPANIPALRTQYAQAEQRLSHTRQTLAAAQSDFQKARKEERRLLELLVTAREAA